ncbi:rhodanese-like domain-containing protein [Ferrimicrobium sp.]|uniref:rhodanese-like domain-containing protein n=1 Tax=Ferrimicrobium sp. TaxID=2926050 RepID=UPI00260F9592|nr:rhodanese-like domain-containing protein [Ferrimicrobium sp.]
MDLEIQIHEFEAMHGDEMEIIDVREEWEYAAGHVPGAVNVPLSSLADNLDAIPNTRHYVICASGGRSLRAAEALRSAGYESVSVAGGTIAWINRGNEVVVDDDEEQSA